ncbi:MAG: gamma-glutamyl-gamma-aminobutyrate hydrolase family protein [Rikenellaceae bacterium]
MKPIIGIIPLWDDDKQSIWMLPGYMDLIRESGGIPIILPLRSSEDDVLSICDLCNGFLLTGGHDVNPSLYGAERSVKCGVTNHWRDSLERTIFDFAVARDLPILGICRGVQLMNVFGGGTLYQDLPTEYRVEGGVNHQMTPPYDQPWHKVRIVDGTPLAKIASSLELEVNSYHHQTIRELAPMFKAMAFSEDGLVEAIYIPERRFIVGVQWHPEFNYTRDTASQQIAKSFIDNCTCR